MIADNCLTNFNLRLSPLPALPNTVCCLVKCVPYKLLIGSWKLLLQAPHRPRLNELLSDIAMHVFSCPSSSSPSVVAASVSYLRQEASTRRRVQLRRAPIYGPSPITDCPREHADTQLKGREMARERVRKRGAEKGIERERNLKSAPRGWQIFDAYSINVNASRPNNKSTDRSNVAASRGKIAPRSPRRAAELMGQELFWSLFDTLFTYLNMRYDTNFDRLRDFQNDLTSELSVCV